MSKKKILTIAISVALVAILVVGASLAFFTDETETLNNVLTVGNVDIELDEPLWDKAVEEATDENPVDHTLLPGKTIVKDPTVTVQPKSADCWLFVKIDLTRYVPLIAFLNETVEGFADKDPIAQSIIFTDTFLDGFTNADWKVMNPEVFATTQGSGGAWPGKVELILGYIGGEKNGILKAGQVVKIFDGVKFPANLSQENAQYFFQPADLAGDNLIKIDIQAMAIQSFGFEPEDAANEAIYHTCLTNAYNALVDQTTPAENPAP